VKKYQPFLLKISAVILGGVFFSFLQLAQRESIADALLIGFFYSILLYFIISLVQKHVIIKITAFTSAQKWLLKTFIYTIAISFTYLAGLLFQTFLYYPYESIQEILTDKIWQGLIAFISSPLRLEVPGNIISGEVRSMIFIFFAMIILIAIVSVIASFIELRWREMKQKQAIDKAELTALRAQIEPHFLFNSLNTIVSLIKNDAQKAEDMLIHLSDILHYMFQNSGKEIIELKSEIAFTKKYLNLMHERFDKNLKHNWSQNIESYDLKVPVFLLQPIIENALRHGWHDRKNQLKIEIELLEFEHYISIKISDDGIGIHPQVLRQLPKHDHALGNIADRLNLLYKKKNLMQISSIFEKGTTIEIKILK
jgi:signal transduction histidine kinase